MVDIKIINKEKYKSIIKIDFVLRACFNNTFTGKVLINNTVQIGDFKADYYAEKYGFILILN